MAKKHKHEEHVNHERWLVSFADMMTLLFALFVVLFSLGQANKSKMKEVKNSIQFAFHIAGEGKTNDIGVMDNMSGGGDVPEKAPLVTAQDGAMREFLKEALPEYEDVVGKSLTIVQTDDTVSLTAPVSDFFDATRPWPIKREVQSWLNRTVTASLTFSSNIAIVIETPELPIGVDPKDGKKRTSVDLSVERLKSLERVIRTSNPEIREGMVSCQWRVTKDRPGASDWEDRATVSIAFSNTRPENR